MARILRKVLEISGYWLWLDYYYYYYYYYYYLHFEIILKFCFNKSKMSGRFFNYVIPFVS